MRLQGTTASQQVSRVQERMFRVSGRRIGFWYRMAAVLCKPPLVVLFKRDWHGMEHIPADGGFITAINHNSYLDPLSYAHFQYNTGRVPRFLAKAALFRGGFMGSMLRGTGQIPVYRESTDAANAFRSPWTPSTRASAWPSTPRAP